MYDVASRNDMAGMLTPSTFASTALATASVIMCVTLNAGCGGAVQIDESPSRIGGPKSQVQLTEIFRAGVTDPLFGRVSDVEIGVDGSVYVADGGSVPQAYRFDDEGSLISNLGARGEGPGEYGRPQSIIAAHDSIIVHDGYWNRIVVYEHDGRPRRKTERLSTVSRESPTSIGNVAMFGGGYVGTEYPVTLPGMPTDAPNDYAIRALDGNGIVGDTLWMISPMDVLIVTDERSMRSMRAPFGRATFCAFGDSRAYCAWTAALDFDVYDATGTPLPSLRIEYSPIPIRESEKTKIREDADDVFLPLLDIPDTRPALLGLTIADDGQLWAKVTVSPETSSDNSPDPDDSPDDQVSHFWIIDPVAREVAEAVVPANVTISSVRDKVACGILTTRESEQLVACYLVGS